MKMNQTMLAALMLIVAVVPAAGHFQMLENLDGFVDILCGERSDPA